MELIINNQQTQYQVEQFEALIQQVIEVGLVLEGRSLADPIEVSVSLVDNPTIQQLNKDYRGKDMPTDVLSFPQDDGDFSGIEGMEQVLGDIVISLERAEQQSHDYDHSFHREVGYLTAHGLLHLLGYDHQSDEERQIMRHKEEQIMNKLNLARD